MTYPSLPPALSLVGISEGWHACTQCISLSRADSHSLCQDSEEQDGSCEGGGLTSQREGHRTAPGEGRWAEAASHRGPQGPPAGTPFGRVLLGCRLLLPPRRGSPTGLGPHPGSAFSHAWPWGWPGGYFFLQGLYMGGLWAEFSSQNLAHTNFKNGISCLYFKTRRFQINTQIFKSTSSSGRFQGLGMR